MRVLEGSSPITLSVDLPLSRNQEAECEEPAGAMFLEEFGLFLNW
jgi:hypothetical protein